MTPWSTWIWVGVRATVLSSSIMMPAVCAALFVVDLIISFFLFLAERGNNDLTELEEGVKSLRMILAIVVTVVVIVIEFQ